MEQDSEKVLEENISLEIKIAHLRANREQIYVLTSERLLSAPKGSVIYRFNSDGGY